MLRTGWHEIDAGGASGGRQVREPRGGRRAEHGRYLRQDRKAEVGDDPEQASYALPRWASRAAQTSATAAVNWGSLTLPSGVTASRGTGMSRQADSMTVALT